MAASAPTPVMSQNARGGRSRPLRTAAVAVAAGSRAMTTAPWLAGVVVSAKDVSKGNPITMPAATTASRAHCVPRGSCLPRECKGGSGQDRGHAPRGRTR